jgi:3-oxoadipate enol-lactonase
MPAQVCCNFGVHIRVPLKLFKEGESGDNEDKTMATRLIDRIAVEVDGDGEPLVMLHGLGGTSNTYTPQMGVLTGRFKVLRIDLPGSGRSAILAALSIQAYVDAVLRVFEALGIERAHLAGHSLGTTVCFHLAVQQPQRVLSLALIAPLPCPPDTARPALRARAEKARSEGMQPIADMIVQAATSGETKSRRLAAVALVRESLMRQDPEGYARSCEALADAQAADLMQIKCPVLLIGGDEDVVAPASSVRSIGEKLSNARTVILSRCGHWLTVENPEEVNTALREFYASRN